MFNLCGPSRKDFRLLCDDVNELLRMMTVMHNHQHNLLERIDEMALDLTVLTEEVARLETVEASAVRLIQSLLEEVAANKDDPAALEALVERIRTSSDDLANAVVAGTPAAPVVDPVPPVE